MKTKQPDNSRKKKYWQNSDLIAIGTFAALDRSVGTLIVVLGGGMNLLAFIAKNMISTALLLILCYKVRKFGVITLYITTTFAVYFIVYGQPPVYGFSMLPLCLLADCMIYFFGGYKSSLGLLCGVAFYDLAVRVNSILWKIIVTREDVSLMGVGLIITAVSYLGCLIGLPLGLKLLKELRHAGIVRQ